MAPHPGKYEKIVVYGYKYVRIHLNMNKKSDIASQTQMYFNVTDPEVNFIAWYYFIQNTPGAVQNALDFAMLNQPGYGRNVEVLGDDRAPATEISRIPAIGLGDLAGVQSSTKLDWPDAHLGIVSQRFSHFKTRLQIVLPDHEHGIILDFRGGVPKDLVGKRIHGKLVRFSDAAPFTKKNSPEP